MNEVKTTLRRMGVYYLLFAINIIPCASILPDVFPVRNFSTIYLLVLSVGLVLYYYHRVSPTGALSSMMKALSWMGLLLILLRGIKYSAVSEVGVLARHTWYLYYAPSLLLPLFLFNISLLVPSKKRRPVLPVLCAALAVTVLLISLILTNDLHSQAFRFNPGFENWDGDYSRGWLFYAATVWQYALYFSAIVILVIKCRIVSAKKKAWIMLIPSAVGIVMNVLLFTGRVPRIAGAPAFEFPETLVFTAAIILECCMGLGLIPTNTNYGRLFGLFPIAAQITDKNGAVVYAARSASPLTPAQFAAPSGTYIDAHTVLNKMEIPGGFGFWQYDMTELDRLNGELTEAKRALEEESELIRLNGELKEKRAVIKQRTLTYDEIAKRTQRQSFAISRLAKEALASPDPALKEKNRRRITLPGAYIKRFANLALLSRQSDRIEAGELALSVSEVLRYLNYNGIPGELVNDADCAVPADAALAVFEAFYELVEADQESLEGAFVNLSGRGGLTFKMTLENFSAPIPVVLSKRLGGCGVVPSVKREDGVTYICFIIPEGGETL